MSGHDWKSVYCTYGTYYNLKKTELHNIQYSMAAYHLLTLQVIVTAYTDSYPASSDWLI